MMYKDLVPYQILKQHLLREMEKGDQPPIAIIRQVVRGAVEEIGMSIPSVMNCVVHNDFVVSFYLAEYYEYVYKLGHLEFMTKYGTQGALHLAKLLEGIVYPELEAVGVFMTSLATLWDDYKDKPTPNHLDVIMDKMDSWFNSSKSRLFTLISMKADLALDIFLDIDATEW